VVERQLPRERAVLHQHIPQRDGGTHLAASARADAPGQWLCRRRRQARKDRADGDDCREGSPRFCRSRCPIEIFLADQGQAVSSEVRPVVENVLNERWRRGSRNTRGGQVIIGKWWKPPPPARRRERPRADPAQGRARHRFASRQARDCQERDPAKSELSSSRRFRRRQRQAGSQPRIPGRAAARGKILNVERARFDKMLSSEQIAPDHRARTGIGRDDFDLSKLRYHKII